MNPCQCQTCDVWLQGGIHVHAPSMYQTRQEGANGSTSAKKAARVMKGKGASAAARRLLMQGRSCVVSLPDRCKMTRWGLRSFTQAPCTG